MDEGALGPIPTPTFVPTPTISALLDLFPTSDQRSYWLALWELGALVVLLGAVVLWARNREGSWQRLCGSDPERPGLIHACAWLLALVIVPQSVVAIGGIAMMMLIPDDFGPIFWIARGLDIASTDLVGLVLFWFLGRKLWKTQRKRVGFHLQNNPEFVVGASLVSAALSFVVFGGFRAASHLTIEHQSTLAERVVSLFTTAGVIARNLPASFTEELLFRQWLLFALMRIFGARTSLVISAAAFVLLHSPQSAPRALEVFSIGILFGWVFLKTGSLFLSWTVHWTSNGLIYLVAAVFGTAQRGPFGLAVAALGLSLLVHHNWKTPPPPDGEPEGTVLELTTPLPPIESPSRGA